MRALTWNISRRDDFVAVIPPNGKVYLLNASGTRSGKWEVLLSKHAPDGKLLRESLLGLAQSEKAAKALAQRLAAWCLEQWNQD